MIYFKNNSLIPIEGFTTMGINAKEGDSPIGHFGTGLKITIAQILARAGEITIYRGLEKIRFFTRELVVREKTFQQVCMERDTGIFELGYTTELGKNWEAWMCMRELESNCRDEGGFSTSRPQEPEEGTTLICVQQKDVEMAWMELDKYFVVGEPLFVHHRLEVYPKPSQFFFYRGIRVGMFEFEVPFTLNFTHASFQNNLTEDRTLSPYYVYPTMAQAAIEIKSPLFQEEFFPAELNRNWLTPLNFDQNYVSPSDAFFDRMEFLRKTHYGAVPRSAINLLIKHGKLDSKQRFDLSDPTALQKAVIDEGLQFIKDLGYPECQYPILIGNLGKDIHGLADTRHGTIYLSPECFGLGRKYVMSTLLEEYIHLSKGLLDCTRAMQQELFNCIISLMESKVYGRVL